MNDQYMEKISKESVELSDIFNDYIKTENLLNQQNWNELQTHIINIIEKHSFESFIHNSTHPCLPQTIEENGYNCLLFLKELFVTKAVCLGIDISKAE